MSAQPEARLAREAELCYCLICMVTDYDCWRSESEDVDVGVILDNLGKNTRAAAQLLRGIAERAAGERTCACGAAARKGGEAALQSMLGPVPDNAAVAAVPDARVLSLGVAPAGAGPAA